MILKLVLPGRELVGIRQSLWHRLDGGLDVWTQWRQGLKGRLPVTVNLHTQAIPIGLATRRLVGGVFFRTHDWVIFAYSQFCLKMDRKVTLDLGWTQEQGMMLLSVLSFGFTLGVIGNCEWFWQSLWPRPLALCGTQVPSVHRDRRRRCHRRLWPMLRCSSAHAPAVARRRCWAKPPCVLSWLCCWPFLNLCPFSNP